MGFFNAALCEKETNKHTQAQEFILLLYINWKKKLTPPFKLEFSGRTGKLTFTPTDFVSTYLKIKKMINLYRYGQTTFIKCK